VLNALEVIWIDDECISPPGPKMVVCVEAAKGYFFRINSRGHRQPAVPLLKGEQEHSFLWWDSYLECGGFLELDDYVVEQSLRAKGIIGQISKKLITQILAALNASEEMSPQDKGSINSFLENARA
jgi:hypothetical protein